MKVCIQKNVFFLFQRFSPSLFDEYDATHSDLSPAVPWTTRRWSPPLPSSQATSASPRHCNGIFIFYFVYVFIYGTYIAGDFSDLNSQ